jgi:hypothetical protein
MFTFLLLDAACAESNANKAKELNPDNSSLYLGVQDEDLDGVAPYLFTFEQKKEFEDWFLENGWGQSWGLLVLSKDAFEQVYNHFRKFLMVKTEDGEQLYFRFYDPRVLRIFLPTCDEKQIIEFFGPVDTFIVEGENREEAIMFSHKNGILKKEIMAAEKIFGDIIKEKIVPDEE